MFGRLRVWREIADVDFGQGFKLPLRAGFDSGQQTSSPYLGEGWSCPLVESNAFYRNKMMMQVTLPCGKTMYLQRDKTDTHKYQTPDKQWTGTLRGNTISISRDDGWVLTYWNGHILKIRTDTNRVFEWVTAGNIVTEIREEGSKGPAPFQLSTTAKGEPNGFYVNGKFYGITLENKPRVVQAGGLSAIASLDPSLGSITWPDKTQEKYTFEVDTSTLTPNFQLTDRMGKQNIYTWDAATLNILTDGVWKYEIGPAPNDLDVPKITRRNDQGQEEFIAIDRNTGIADIKTLDLGHQIREGFISPGPLFGKVHKIEQVDDQGKQTLIYQAGYDELGRLLRVTGPDGFTTAYKLNKDGMRIGEVTMLPTDPDKLKALQDQEKDMLDGIAKTKKEPQLGDDLEALAFFYIHKMNEPDKALALLPQMTNRSDAFNVQLAVVAGSQTLKPEEKIAGLQKLLEKYPEQKRILAALIKDNQTEIDHEKTS